MEPQRIKAALVAGGIVVGLVAAWCTTRGRARPEPAARADSRQEARPHGAELYEGIYRESLDRELRFELTPGAHGVVSSAGFMDREYAVERPPSTTLRVLGLGDSVTMYFAAEPPGVEAANYLSVLERELAREHSGVEVINLGVGGYDTPQSVRLLELRGLSYGPDVVTLGWVVNDSVEFSALLDGLTGAPSGVEVNDDSEATQARARAAAAGLGWAATYRQHIARSRRSTDCLWALGKLGRLAEAEGFQVVMLLFPALMELDDYWLAPVHEAVAAAARSHGFAVLDLTDAFRQAGVRSLQAEPGDVIHPNARGNRLAYEALRHWFDQEAPWRD